MNGPGIRRAPPVMSILPPGLPPVAPMLTAKTVDDPRLARPVGC